MNVNNHFRPLWMRADCSWSRMRIAWRCLIRALRPIRFAIVGSSAIVAPAKRRTARRYRPIRYPHAFALEVAALVRYVTQHIIRRVSRGIRASFPAFALGADTPALLRRGAMQAPGGQLDFS